MRYPNIVMSLFVVSLLFGAGALMAAGIAFDPGQTYPSGTFPTGMCSADFNNDENLDLACVNRGVDSVTILFNRGGGVFDSSASYSVPSGTSYPCATDLDGNGWADLVVPNYFSNSMSVFINNGDGTFASSVEYPAAGNPQTPVAVDLNQDSKPDLVLTVEMSHVCVFINQGDGTFESAVSVDVSGISNVGCSGDFDGDNKPDIAIGAYDPTNQVTILFGKGDGTFDSAVSYGGVVDANGVSAADFNGDGRLDLAFGCNTDADQIAVLMNNGDGTFSAAVHYQSWRNVQGICSGDFDSDGHPDLAASSATTGLIRVFRNDGGGLFSFAAELGGVCWPASIVTTDLDGDDRLDLIAAELVTTNVVHVFMNQKTDDNDHDGIPDSLDNCPRTFNPDQQDVNQNGIGTVCDSSESTFFFKSTAETTSKTAVLLSAGSELDISCNGIKMHFQSVLDDGVLDADTSNIGQLPAIDMLSPIWYGITTSARFNDLVTVQISYDPGGNDPNKVRLLHFSGNPPIWQDVSSANDLVTHEVSGRVSSLSQFVLALFEAPVCGDANGDAAVNISDAVYLIAYIFAGGAAPDPILSGDANCDNAVNISDAVYLIAYIFAGGAAPCALCP